MARVFIGLGSNLGQRAITLQKAVNQIREIEGIKILGQSRWHETECLEDRRQPLFLNGVLEIDSGLSPRSLLQRLLSIEEQLGRDRVAGKPRWAPRTIDLDLLWYDGVTVKEDNLEIPHPRMGEREFVLQPLSELDALLADEMRERRRS